MKKKVRAITVDGVEYAWAVESRNWPNFVLKVWRGKGALWFERPFDLHDDGPSVTPQRVAAEIAERLANDASTSVSATRTE